MVFENRLGQKTGQKQMIQNNLNWYLSRKPDVTEFQAAIPGCELT